MEACDTSMEKFYSTMHRINETKHLDILLKRMINHVGEKIDFFFLFVFFWKRSLTLWNFLSRKAYFIVMLNHRIF